MRRAVFLDRDGTINEDNGYVFRPEDLRLLPGAADAIARLNRAEFLVLVVTNQSGVARGLYHEADVQRFHDHLSQQLAIAGAHVDRYYYSPYHPEGQGDYRRVSRCRKPDVGMYEMALADFPIDTHQSYMVGDHWADMLFAQRAGLFGILLRPHGFEGETSPDFHGPIVSGLPEAVDMILSRHTLREPKKGN